MVHIVHSKMIYAFLRNHIVILFIFRYHRLQTDVSLYKKYNIRIVKLTQVFLQSRIAKCMKKPIVIKIML